jgi:osmoprotectant transport system permease protein
MKPRPVILALVFSLLACAPAVTAGAQAAGEPVVVGSKEFPESYILGEIMAQLLEDRGFAVRRKFGLSGTLVAFESMRKGDIDVYAEYSGTLEQAILKSPRRGPYAELQAKMKRTFDMDLLEPLGFDNTYALAMGRARAEQLGIKTISDLPRFPDLRFGVSHDFLNRNDCWPGLSKAYGLTARPSGLNHALVHRAIRDDKLDVTDVYSTDGDIVRFDLLLLVDDRRFFPNYLAAPLVRGEVDERVKPVLNELAGRIDDTQMQRLNVSAVGQPRSFEEVAPELAHQFLTTQGLLREEGYSAAPGKWTTLLVRVGQHLKITLVALLAGIVVAVPCGVLVYRLRFLSRPVIYVAGLLQTVPSLALLAFMIPLLGTGEKPAIVALFLYALLPILRNTAVALFMVDPVLKKVSVGMGLTLWQRLRHVELPLAWPAILSGIKTAAVINIGTATLATYIGAGGLGEPIATGLQTNDPYLILWGVIPAALLAILTELAFEGIEKLVIPRHLLQKPAE